MKKLLAMLLLTALPLAAPAKVVSVATAPGTGETMSLTDEKWECPSGQASDGYKWDARMVIYHDPRDKETEKGCYIIDTRESPTLVIIIFRTGSYAGQPISIELRRFKPEI